MARNQNLHYFVSSEEIVSDHAVAIYSTVVPGTPAAFAGRWAGINGTLYSFNVTLYEGDNLITRLDTADLSFARRLCREWAKVNTDGKPYTPPSDHQRD